VVDFSRRRRLWAAALAIAVVGLSLITVTVTGPRVSIRWRDSVGAAERRSLEARHGLRNGRLDDPSLPLVWRYELGDWSRDAVAALVREPAVADTNYIDRTTYGVDEPEVTVATRIPAVLAALPFPFNIDNRFDSRARLFHVQSLCLLLAGAALLRAARFEAARRRRWAVGALLAVAVCAVVFAYPPSLLRMADSAMYTKNRTNFETALQALNFENHLTLATLVQVYRWFGVAEDAPERTFQVVSRLATMWFVVCAFAIGMVERWSPHVVRYLALVVAAPITLMYFGHRDFAYLSLNLAAFPLLAHGIARGGLRLEAGSAFAGLGAAFHGFGLVSLAGAWLGALAVRVPIRHRLERVLRIAAWGTAAWLGWIAIDIIVLKLQIATGHAASGSWHPLFVDERTTRLNPALFSAIGLRDLFMSAWVVGAPLIAVAASLWTRYRDDARLVACYVLPSLLLLTFYWPPQGPAVDTGHVFATFPAVFACAWLCAREPRHAVVAAVVLATAHIGFWRLVLDTRFVNWALPS
jgi:hypothetical protein